jgi:exoribonuclease R
MKKLSEENVIEIVNNNEDLLFKKFNLDEDGKPLGVFFKTQKDAHKLIEDFMLLANRKVAEFLGKPKGAVNQNSKKGSHSSNLCVYRIHDVPSEEKMNQLTGFVARFGYKVDVGSKKKSVDSINKLLKDIKGKKEQSIIEILARGYIH